MSCEGKTAIVAGGLGGIGYATCKQLLSKGIKSVGIFDLIENEGLVKSLSGSYPMAVVGFWKVDATKKDDVENAFKSVLRDFGSIDIFVSCVGIINELQPQLCVDVNLMAIILLNYAAIDCMSITKGGNGGIVANVASMVGVQPFAPCPIYSATKHGVVGLTRSLGCDYYLATTGIRFIAVCPGLTDTPIMQLLPESFRNTILTSEISVQSPDVCAKLLVESIQINKNGSIWNISNGQMKEIEITVS